jgi:hypothetical protein
MNHLRNTLAAVGAAAALSLLSACGVEAPASQIGGTVDEKTSDTPAPKAPVKTNANRLDFGDGEATLPATPKARPDDSLARLDFGDDGRP